MAALYAIELIAGCALFLLLITQVLLPLMLDRPLFPAFRKAQRAVSEELSEAKEDRDLAAMLKTVREIQKDTSKINQEERNDQAGS